MHILATLLALVTSPRRAHVLPDLVATDDELLAVASAMGVARDLTTAADDELACPTWCMLPAGHAPEDVDEHLGCALVVHRAMLTAPADGGPRLDLAQTVVVADDGSTCAEEPLVVVDGRPDDTLTAEQARHQAAALLSAADVLAGGAR